MSDIIAKRYLPFITIMYGIGTLLVVLGHSHPIHAESPRFFESIIGFIYDFHMPLFFCVAGVLIGNSSENAMRIIPWWIKKVKKLMIPYLVLSVVAVIPKYLLRSIMKDNMDLSWMNIIRIIFVPRENVWGHFWFVPVYLFLELIGAGFYYFNSVLKDKGHKISCCILKILGGGIGLYLTIFPINIEWFGIRDICVFLVYVFLGMFVYEQIVLKNAYSFFDNIVCMILSFVISIIIFIVCEEGALNRMISFLMIYFIMGISIKVSSYNSKILNYVGKHAFTIYIWSWPIQAVLEILLVVKLRIGWGLVYPLMFTTGLVGPIVIYELSRKIFKNNKFINGMVGR